MSTMASQITGVSIVYSAVFFRSRSKKTSKLRVTGLCVGNSPVTGEFPAQMASNAENVSINFDDVIMLHELRKWVKSNQGYISLINPDITVTYASCEMWYTAKQVIKEM